MAKTYFIKTYGCQMNDADSDRLAAVLESAGYQPINETMKQLNKSQLGFGTLEHCDIILVNTCVVRQNAEDRAAWYIQSLKGIKKKNPNLIIGVCGCIVPLPDRDLKKQFPHVDFFLPPNSPDLLLKYLNINSSFARPERTCPEFHRGSRGIIRHSSFVSIMTGCNNFCSYCVVPFVRGRETSRPMDEVLAEIKNLLGSGVTDITLLGQNVNSYKHGLADLLNNIHQFVIRSSRAHLSRVPSRESRDHSSFVIRFLTSHPRDMSDEIIQAVYELPYVAKDFLIPLQSGDDEILKKMNRGYTFEHYVDRVSKIRSKMPEARISTDIMVGFPGETEEQFQNTLHAVQSIAFNDVHMFAYSDRPGTAAGKMQGQLPEEIKQERLQKLINTVRKMTAKNKYNDGE